MFKALQDGHYAGCSGALHCSCKARRYFFLLLIPLPFMGGELFAGIWSGSIALIADALHMFTDFSTILIAFVMAVVEAKRWRYEFWKIFGKVGILLSLGMLVAMIIASAIDHLQHPQEIDGRVVMLAAAWGGFGNWLQHKVISTAPHEHRDVFHHGAATHILTDLWMSVVVFMGGAIIWHTDITWIDPLASLIIAAWVIKRMWDLVREKPHNHQH